MDKKRYAGRRSAALINPLSHVLVIVVLGVPRLVQDVGVFFPHFRQVRFGRQIGLVAELDDLRSTVNVNRHTTPLGEQVRRDASQRGRGEKHYEAKKQTAQQHVNRSINNTVDGNDRCRRRECVRLH